MRACAHTCVIRTAFKKSKKAKNQYEFQNNYLLFICIILCHIVQLVHTCMKKVKVDFTGGQAVRSGVAKMCISVGQKIRSGCTLFCIGISSRFSLYCT